MKLFLVSILLLISTNSLLAQNQLTLDQAIKIALQKNTGLISQENELAKGESGVDAAYGNFLPDLNAYGSWDWNRSEEAGRTSNVNGVNVTFPAK